jgi:hypothetical protein
MGVIKRFAIWSMVLGTLAIAGGASALAFDGTGSSGSTEGTSAPVLTEPVAAAPVETDDVPLVSDVPSDAAADAAAALMRWAAPHTIPAE